MLLTASAGKDLQAPGKTNITSFGVCNSETAGDRTDFWTRDNLLLYSSVYFIAMDLFTSMYLDLTELVTVLPQEQMAN